LNYCNYYKLLHFLPVVEVKGIKKCSYYYSIIGSVIIEVLLLSLCYYIMKVIYILMLLWCPCPKCSSNT